MKLANLFGGTVLLVCLLVWPGCRLKKLLESESCLADDWVACPDGDCIPEDFLCDGGEDCSDGWDEEGCDDQYCSGFVCWSGECIDAEWVCDGMADCPSGEDENGCGGIQTVTLRITDGCNDGYDIQFRIFNQTSSTIWPDGYSTYQTRGFEIEETVSLSCEIGDELCYGAQAGSSTWGVGLGAEYGCSDCCVICEEGLDTGWRLSCE